MLTRIAAGLVASLLTLVAAGGAGGDDRREPRPYVPPSTTSTSVASPPPSSSTSTAPPVADPDVDCGGWFDLVASIFPVGHQGTACRVLLCESEGRATAVNASSGASGLFQVMPFWASRFEQVTGLPYYDGRFDPGANATFAWYLVSNEGWASQFACY